MPELPDVDLYVEKLEELVLGATLEQVQLASAPSELVTPSTARAAASAVVA